MTTAGHATRQRISVLESGLVNRRLKLNRIGAWLRGVPFRAHATVPCVPRRRQAAVELE